jgi:rare lipoprotein A
MDLYKRIGPAGRIAQFMALGAAFFLLAACANSNMAGGPLASRGGGGAAAGASQNARGATTTVRRAGAAPSREPAHNSARARTGSAHTGAGYSAVGLASWYGAPFHGRLTADGETFDMNSLTAAHRTLPLPCRVRVTNLANRRSLVVRVNDRGPYVGRRVIDVSAKSAKLLGFYERGLAKVKVEYLGRAPRRLAGGKPMVE